MQPSFDQLEKFGEKALYLVRCENCKKVYFERNVNALMEAVMNGEWIAIVKGFLIPSARHWIDNRSHVINIRVVSEEDQLDEVIYSLSDDWQQNLPLQQNQSREALLEEIELMEQKL